MLVADLDHPLGSQRDERQVLADRPAAALGVARRAGALLLLGPRPRVIVEGGDQRLQLDEQLLAPGGRKRADHADRLASSPASVYSPSSSEPMPSGPLLCTR